MQHDCTQAERLKRIETMQDGFTSMAKELRSALLPDEFHPDNGLINQVKRIQENLREISHDMTQFNNTATALAESVGELSESISGIMQFQSEFTVFKIQTETAVRMKEKYRTRIWAVISLSFGLISALIVLILKQNGIA